MFCFVLICLFVCFFAVVNTCLSRGNWNWVVVLDPELHDLDEHPNHLNNMFKQNIDVYMPFL